ncbi:S1/P1 Nuclease [Enhydrobacter aerosaccus]|uniref:S1/P1 Nuclease n=2 Tax=Enhydrobacter aerosaccus TaxID=225324 RepID=A0A1T4TLM7_9HYPH|nr:S1/P1 Nuclease [Enhydrobacter aerosaccus]
MALRVKVAAIALLGGLLLSGEACAWGDMGHKIICELASRLVTQQTHTKIEQMIRADGEFSSFSEACTWADQPRKRAGEHFLNLPRNSMGLSAENCDGASECVVTAIDKDFAALAAKTTDAQSRVTSLKFLGHWVGDVHQPLHVSFADDRGGNEIKTTGECGPNLHAIWDTCLVDRAVGADVDAAASKLLSEVTPQQRRQWAGGTAKDWANEAFAIARRQETQYCEQQGDSFCVRRAASVTIDSAYVAVNSSVVREQLLKAAVRLARLLDRALSP